MVRETYAERKMVRLHEKINDLVAFCDDVQGKNIPDKAKNKFQSIRDDLIRLGWEANI